jgi:hypothetical protein
MQLFRGQQRKARSKVKAHLVPKNSPRARSGTITTIDPALKNARQKFKILLHRLKPVPST